jgi:hypothetical protein
LRRREEGKQEKRREGGTEEKGGEGGEEERKENIGIWGYLFVGFPVELEDKQ